MLFVCLFVVCLFFACLFVCLFLFCFGLVFLHKTLLSLKINNYIGLLSTRRFLNQKCCDLRFR